MFEIPYFKYEEFFYLNTFLKLLIGLLSTSLIINKLGKNNMKPSSAMDQVYSYVLGGIVGGVIYNPLVNIFNSKNRF